MMLFGHDPETEHENPEIEKTSLRDRKEHEHETK